ncbi:MAG: hypothetical protein SNJ59_03745 [Aggregatilineales bacterium]
MEPSSQLRTLPQEALDILRYFRSLEATAAHTDDIIEGTGLSDHGFGKAIRRLVTKNILIMDGRQIYRLTNFGQRLLSELETSSEQNAPTQAAQAVEPRFVHRRLVLVVPAQLRMGQPTHVVIGFEEANDDDIIKEPAQLRLQLNMANGEPAEPVESALLLNNRAARQTFEIAAGAFTSARVRLRVLQTINGEAAPFLCGGLYVDLPVNAGEGEAALSAFGTTLRLIDPASAASPSHASMSKAPSRMSESTSTSSHLTETLLKDDVFQTSIFADDSFDENFTDIDFGDEPFNQDR